MTIRHDKAIALAAGYTAAWNTGAPEAVAGFFAESGAIVINDGAPWQGREGVAEMAAGFFAEIPDLRLTCDGVRTSNDHVVYLWTFTGAHAATKIPVRVIGWEEWDLDPSHLIMFSRGWFDATDYARQISGEAR